MPIGVISFASVKSPSGYWGELSVVMVVVIVNSIMLQWICLMQLVEIDLGSYYAGNSTSETQEGPN